MCDPAGPLTVSAVLFVRFLLIPRKLNLGYDADMAEMTYTTDTSTEATKHQSLAFEETSPVERISKVCRLSSNLRTMARDAIRRNHPEFDSKQVELKLIELNYGKELADAVRQWTGEHLQ